MKRAAKLMNRGNRSKTATIPSPVRGLNAREPVSAMNPTDALLLDNMICRSNFLEVRKGRANHVTGFANTVETLMVYSPMNGAESELWAIAGGSIFNATVAGAVPAAAVSGLGNSYWNHTQVSNIAGNFLIACNGLDSTRIYNGTAWALFGGTGLPITDIIHVTAWKRRLWCVEKNSFKVWYSASDAIAGALSAFNFSGIFRRGGNLLAMIPWTVDGGVGADDYLIAVTTQGEAAVYKGTDPAVAGSFTLVGVFYIGAPVGSRFYAQLGGDVLMLTAEGLIPFSRYLQSQDRTTALTNRIDQLIAADIAAYGSLQGWELHVFYDDNFLFIHVPLGVSGMRYQYVMNLISGAWSRFLIGEATTWAVKKNKLYFGGLTTVFDGWATGKDVDEPILYQVIPAFSYFKSPAQLKKFNLARIVFQSDIVPQYRTQLLLDFSQEYFTYPLAPLSGGASLWDVAAWDVELWDSLATYSRQWYALAGLGYAATQVIYGISYGDTTRIVTLDYVYESGGLL